MPNMQVTCLQRNKMNWLNQQLRCFMVLFMPDIFWPAKAWLLWWDVIFYSGFWELKFQCFSKSFKLARMTLLEHLQLDKYKNYDFGRCPRVYCCGQACLPVGQSDIPRSSSIKIYCPRCEDIYYPRSKYQGSILFPLNLLLQAEYKQLPCPRASFN